MKINFISNPVFQTSFYSKCFYQKDIDLIKKALIDISNNPHQKATLNYVSELTGLDKNTINNRLHSKYGNEIMELWQELHNRVIPDDDLSKTTQDKQFGEIKALRIIKHALECKEPVKYSYIQSKTGLSKTEIDDVISKYAQYLQNKPAIAKERKELQAKWYKENYSKFQDSYVKADFMTMCDEIDMIEDAILQLSQKSNRVTISQIAEFTGLRLPLVHNRIHSKLGQSAYELYLQANEK